MLLPLLPTFAVLPMVYRAQRPVQLDNGASIVNGDASVIATSGLLQTTNGIYPPPKPPNDPVHDEDDDYRESRAIAGPVLSVITAVYNKIMAHLGSWDGREDGGILFGPNGSSVVTFYCPDEGGERCWSSFRLNHRRANRIIKWCKRFDLQALGTIHAHPPGIIHLSRPDLRYGRNLFANPKNDAGQFFMPLVVDGRLIPYLLRRDEPDAVIAAQLQLID